MIVMPLRAKVERLLAVRRPRPLRSVIGPGGGRAHNNGLLHHLWATSPWIVVVLVGVAVVVWLITLPLRMVGKAFEGAPWWVRLGVIGAVGAWLVRRFTNKPATSPGRPPWRPPV